jgi:ABC-type transport system involved in cytochrome c biogenesis permease subunit
MSEQINRYFPVVFVLLFAGWIAAAAVPPADAPGTMRVYEFAQLPVVSDGRVKPFDTLANNSLFILSQRQTFKDFTDPKDGDGPVVGPAQPAIKWLLDTLTSGEFSHQEERAKADEQREKDPKFPEYVPPAELLKVFRVENDQVVNLFNLPARPEFWRYSYDELTGNRQIFKEFLNRVAQAESREPDKRDLTDQKLLELERNLRLYRLLVMMQSPRMELANREAEKAGRPRLETPLTVAPRVKDGNWHSLGTSLCEKYVDKKPGVDPGAELFDSMLDAYSKGDVKGFNSALDQYKQYVATVVPASEIETAKFETWFNHFAPFDLCSIFYVVVFLLVAVSWIGWSQPLNRAAFGLGMLTLVVHTGAILGRMYIQGRPPITNLYSTAVFIGWGCVLTGLILERLFKNGLGTAVAALCGALTLRLAGALAENKPDTLEMMQAVLDTNFWLATHVTSVNTGYIATFVAGAIGCVFILRGALTQVNRLLPPPASQGLPLILKVREVLDRATLTPDAVKRLGQMLYGVVCFATLFSFVGTVLGGIWGDYSWGRFWGWDPKENGALMIVIWNALILHARWGGMVKVRGMAVLAVIGNLITAWSYFGTNQLQVGLHSYGFSKELADGLRHFWMMQVPFIAFGVLPLQIWRGWTPPKPEPSPDAAPEARKGDALAVPATAVTAR